MIKRTMSVAVWSMQVLNVLRGRAGRRAWASAGRTCTWAPGCRQGLGWAPGWTPSSRRRPHLDTHTHTHTHTHTPRHHYITACGWRHHAATAWGWHRHDITAWRLRSVTYWRTVHPSMWKHDILLCVKMTRSQQNGNVTSGLLTCLQRFALHVGLAVGGLGQCERFTQNGLVLDVTQQARVHHGALAQHLHTQHRAHGQRLDAQPQGQQSTTRNTTEFSSQQLDAQYVNSQQSTTRHTTELSSQHRNTTVKQSTTRQTIDSLPVRQSASNITVNSESTTRNRTDGLNSKSKVHCKAK